ncbi:MAG TPA: hypothetical protein VFE06_17880 [Acidobacteriaceae bacterium]|jgi:hypothetical protein|nr:hypothetical protein [Acidobacteriaceae bacterium]
MTLLVEETGTRFLAADRVWIATALLHMENPKREDFSKLEIRDRGKKEGFVEKTNTFQIHVNQHCVANRKPDTVNHRMLFRTIQGRRRLFREGDTTSPGRVGKITPNREEIPSRYHYLLDWYLKWAAKLSPGSEGNGGPASDPLLRLRGSGREIWKHEHADEFVRKLREGWE